MAVSPRGSHNKLILNNLVTRIRAAHLGNSSNRIDEGNVVKTLAIICPDVSPGCLGSVKPPNYNVSGMLQSSERRSERVRRKFYIGPGGGASMDAMHSAPAVMILKLRLAA